MALLGQFFGLSSVAKLLQKYFVVFEAVFGGRWGLLGVVWSVKVMLGVNMGHLGQSCGFPVPLSAFPKLFWLFVESWVSIMESSWDALQLSGRLLGRFEVRFRFASG